MVHQLGTNGGVYLLGDYGRIFYRNDAMPDWVAYESGLPLTLNTDIGQLGIQYRLGKLRLGGKEGVWQVDLYEPSTTTLVQPMASTVSPCLGDTVQFDSYSVVNGNASYLWTFSPAPAWVSDVNARNPRVKFGSASGPYTVDLTVTDANGATTRTLPYMITSGGVVQWADSVVAFSSQYNPLAWDAKEALGPPTVYPLYGDYQYAWASLTPDDQQEFLELHFPSATPINMVQVIETYNPGALTKVSVKNPSTHLYQQVWAGTAHALPPASRANTVRFPTTAFAVNEVRLDFDSPAVPDWNEVDAVGIGLDVCSGDATVSVPPAPRGITPLFARPNPSRGQFTLSFDLGAPALVSLRVYDVSGRQVARLLEGKMLTGSQRVVWDGRSSAGARVAPGVYLVRLDAGGSVQTARLVKID
jgi:PKD repeat protein